MKKHSGWFKIIFIILMVSVVCNVYLIRHSIIKDIESAPISESKLKTINTVQMMLVSTDNKIIEFNNNEITRVSNTLQTLLSADTISMDEKQKKQYIDDINETKIKLYACLKNNSTYDYLVYVWNDLYLTNRIYVVIAFILLAIIWFIASAHDGD